MVDILIENGRILTPNGWNEEGYLAISGGNISALGLGEASKELSQSAKQVISARGMAVLPGLTNAHTHLSQTFMRGLADRRPLSSWLEEVVWPIQENMSVEELSLAALLGLVENLHSGVTHIVDHQKICKNPSYTLSVCAAAHKTGLRLTAARAWADRGLHSEAAHTILAELTALFEQFDKDPLVHIANGPLALWRVNADTLQKSQRLAQNYGGVTHMHVSETREEVQKSLDATGMRPIVWLDSLGVLGPDSQIIHCVWVDAQEIGLLAKRHASMVHCPISNAVLASGTAPLGSILQAGIKVCLGTDGPASNDTQDCFENMKFALCLGRVSTLNSGLLSPAQTLNMALAGKSLSINLPADLILVNLESISAAPVHDLDSALVLSTRSSDVDTVIVGGKVLMQHKKVLFLDETILIKECQQAAKNLLKRAKLN